MNFCKSEQGSCVVNPTRVSNAPLWVYPTAAFTIIELMVTVAIITLLASLLFPALVRGKTVAQRAKCLNNLRQLGLASQLYWDDNSGRCFRYRGRATNGGDIFWFGWLSRNAETRRAFDPSQAALYPYLASRGIEICPRLDYAMAEFKLKAVGAAYGYGYNIYLSAPDAEPAVAAARIHRISEAALFGDSAQVNTFQAPASPDHPMLEEFYYLSTNEPTTHFRHDRQASVAFADGHVGGERPRADSLDLRLPRQIVGCLQPERLRLD